jgi:hypothetical protein
MARGCLDLFSRTRVGASSGRIARTIQLPVERVLLLLLLLLLCGSVISDDVLDDNGVEGCAWYRAARSFSCDDGVDGEPLDRGMM